MDHVAVEFGHFGAGGVDGLEDQACIVVPGWCVPSAPAPIWCQRGRGTVVVRFYVFDIKDRSSLVRFLL
ncbi:MAG: hypothetical protein RBT81_03675 [Gammaproteobacteria bacterium]|jgi:hypothetical protein|nr:hypothetical protein [Gammaproteobacteria bacterium]